MSTTVAISSIPLVFSTALNVGVIVGNETTGDPGLSFVSALPPTVTTLDPVDLDESTLTGAALVPFEVYVEVSGPVSLEPDALETGGLAMDPVVTLGGLAGATGTTVMPQARLATVYVTFGVVPEPDEVGVGATALDPTVAVTAPVALTPDEAEVGSTALVPVVVLTDGNQPPMIAMRLAGLAYDPLVQVFGLVGGDSLEFGCTALDAEVETTSTSAIELGYAEMSATSGAATVSFDTDVAAPDTPQVVASGETPTVLATVEQTIEEASVDLSGAVPLPTVSVLPGTNQLLSRAITARAWPVFVYAEGPDGVPQYAEVNLIWSPISTEVELSAAIGQEVELTAYIARTVILDAPLWEDGLVVVEAIEPPTPPKPPFDPYEPELPGG